MLYLQQLIKSMSRKNVSKDILLEGIKWDFTPKQTILKDHATKYFPCNMCTPRPSSKPYLLKGFAVQSRKWLLFCNYVCVVVIIVTRVVLSRKYFLEIFFAINGESECRKLDIPVYYTKEKLTSCVQSKKVFVTRNN